MSEQRERSEPVVAGPARSRSALGSAFLAAIGVLAVVVGATLWGQLSGQGTSPTGPPPSGSPPTMGAASPDPSTPAATHPALAYSCGSGDPFSPTLLGEPPLDLRSIPAGMALAGFIASGHDEEHTLPRRGDWHLVAQRDDHAEFVAAVPGDPPYVNAQVDLENGEWGVTAWGHCRPRVALDGTGPASWVLAPDQEIDPNTTSFFADVTERACAGGRSSEGRVRGPLIAIDAERVIVIFTVDPLPGAQTCPGNPATRVEVQLPEPLGDRRLYDGGEYPFGDPTKQEPWMR